MPKITPVIAFLLGVAFCYFLLTKVLGALGKGA